MNQSITSNAAPFSLPPETIVAIKRDLDALVEALEEMRQRIADKQADFEAAMRFKPPGFDLEHALSTIPPPILLVPPKEDEEEEESPEETEGRVTWIGEVRKILSTTRRGWAYPDLLAELKSGPLGERPSPKEKGFYTAVSKVQDQKEAIKKGNLLYSMDVYKEMKRRGAEFPEAVSSIVTREGSSTELVKELIAKYPKGITVQIMKDMLCNSNDVPKSLLEHKQYIYSVLKKLIDAGEIRNKDGFYSLVK